MTQRCVGLLLLCEIVVIGASRLGMPVSTTHVSCGALFGIGAATRQARYGMITKIHLAWVTTLPLGTASYWTIVATK